MSIGHTDRKKVPVDEEMLAFFHAQLAVNSTKIRSILGDGGSRIIFGISADALMKAMKGDERLFRPVDDVIMKLKEWGITVEQEESEDSEDPVTFRLKCPFAGSLHAKLWTGAVCPCGEYLLGAVRLEYSKSWMTKNTLKKDGAEIVVSRTTPMLISSP